MRSCILLKRHVSKDATRLNTAMYRPLFKVPLVQTWGDQDVYPRHSTPSLQVISQCDDIECKLETCVLHDTDKHGWCHHDAVNRINICLKTIRNAIFAFRFVVEYTTKGVPVCDAASSFAVTLVDNLTMHVALDTVQLFVQILAALQTFSFLDSAVMRRV